MKISLTMTRTTISFIRWTFILFILAVVTWGASSVKAKLTQTRKDTSSVSAKTDSMLPSIDPKRAAELRQSFGKLPMQFEANQGQAGAATKFIARGSGYSLSLQSNQAVLRLRNVADAAHNATKSAELGLHFLGSNPNVSPQGKDLLPGKSNYFVGNDPTKWKTNVVTFGKVKYPELYPGIDLVYYGKQGELEYDFVIAPGADARKIQMTFSGAQSLHIAKNGQLVLKTALGNVLQRKPVIYQLVDGQRRNVQGRYVLLGKDRIGFQLGKYDRSLPLVIDPILEYSTPLGGINSDQGLGIAVDKDGNVYVTGDTTSNDFPIVNAYQATKNSFSLDAFVLKLNATGTAIVYSTFLGGAGIDTANGIALDSDGNAYVTGVTTSTDFPVTNGSYQTNFKGLNDAFVTKLNAAGSALAYSTYLGGASRDVAVAIAIDNSGSAYITGRTDSNDLPATGLQATRQGSLAYHTINRADNWNTRQNGLMGSATLAIAVNPSYPNIVFLSTNSGFYRTINEGTLWQPLTLPSTGFTNFIQAIAVNPKVPSVVYGGGVTLFKSTDDGATWTVKANGLLFNNVSLPVNALAIDPKQPDTIYAGTGAGVYKSTDGGENWVSVNNGLNYQPQTQPQIRITELVIDPNNTSTVYAGTAFGIFKTTDGGNSWIGFSGGFPTIGQLPSEVSSLVLDATNPAILYASPFSGMFGVYKSINGAMSWARVSDGLSLSGVSGASSIPVNALATDPKTSGIVYAGTSSGGVFVTTDGGTSWSRVGNGITNTNVVALAIDPMAPAKIYAGTNIGNDGFVAKLNPAGSQLSYLSYLGGSEEDEGRGIAVDKDNNAYVVGSTASANYPTVNPFQSSFAGTRDVVLSKINPSGTALIYSTFLGGSSDDQARGIALNTAGEAHVTGFTFSQNFPTLNAIKSTNNGFFDAFVTKFSSDATKLIFSTYLGGQTTDQGLGIAIDKVGDVYVTGLTNSFDFPTVNAFQTRLNGPSGSGGGSDAFITKIESSGTKIIFSSFLGGRLSDQANAIAVDANGSAHLTGITGSFDFPVAKPIGAVRGGGDVFITKLTTAADLSITMTDSRDPVMVNNEFSYTLTATNQGPDTANDVVVTNTLPANVTVSSSAASQGTCSGTGTITCNLGAMAQNAKVTITITLKANAVGTITNQATVTSSLLDQKTDNNSASQSTKISDKPSVLGRVALAGGAGVGRVTMALTGTTTTTNSDGAYQFLELPVGSNITITPTRKDYVFNPPRQTLNNLNQDQFVNFTAVLCDFTLTPSNQQFSNLGGTGTIQISGPDAQCAWAARSNDAWIKLTSPTSGMQTGTVNFTVEPAAASRSGTITVAGKTFTVVQAVSPCIFGSFDLPASFGVNLSATQFISRDFNGDKFVDVAMLTAAPNPTIALALNDGKGNFNQPVPVLTNIQPKTLLSGDVNADGKMDLVMINTSADNNVYVLLGNGTGGFAAPLTFSAGTNPNLGTLGDFNGDQKLDLFVANGNPAGNGTAHIAALYFGNGDGTFGAARNIGDPAPFFAPARQVDPGDFNGDGKLDVLLTTNSFGMQRLLGDGMGGFQTNVATAPLVIPDGAVVADFNRDGKSDFAYGFNNKVQIFLDITNASFASYEMSNARRFAAADINTDGKVDLIGLSEDGVLIRYGNGDGTFGELVVYNAVVTGSAMSVLDADADGRLDILVAGTIGNTQNSTLAWTLLRGAKNGGINAPRQYIPLPINPNISGTGIQNLYTADFNRDGLVDILAMASGRFAVLQGNGIGGFKPAEPVITEASGDYVKIHDFNRDGNLDVAVLEGNTNRLFVFINDGKGKFPTKWTIPQIPFANNFEVADFNQDGKEDLLIKTSTSELSILTGDGNGAFTETVKGIAPPGNIRANQTFALGDYNGDGVMDIGIVNTPTFRRCEEIQIWVLPGEGIGSFGEAIITNLPAMPELLYARDLNGDGRTDLVYTEICSANRNNINVLFANADGTFAQPSVLPVGATPKSIAFGDLNGDGRRDIVVTNTASGNITILHGSVGNSFLAPQYFASFPTPGGVAVGDFNGDGKSDLTVSNLNTTSVVAWFNNNRCYAANNVYTTNAANYLGTKLTAESIASSFGQSLATQTQVAPAGTSLPTSLAGTTVKLKDSTGTEFNAQLFFVSAEQVNWLIPKGVAAGVATVTITSGSSSISVGTFEITTVFPGIFAATSDGVGVLAASVVRVSPSGVFSSEFTFTFLQSEKRFIARELVLGSDQLFLEIYGTGIRNRSGLPNVSARIGSVAADVLYAGAQCCFAGIDQINVKIPPSMAGRGEVDVVLTIDGRETNPLRINVK